jgi:hypothetical protein
LQPRPASLGQHRFYRLAAARPGFHQKVFELLNAAAAEVPEVGREGGGQVNTHWLEVIVFGALFVLGVLARLWK